MPCVTERRSLLETHNEPAVVYASQLGTITIGSSMNVPDPRIAICLQLVPASSQQVFDCAKVFLANIEMLPKFIPGMHQYL